MIHPIRDVVLLLVLALWGASASAGPTRGQARLSPEEYLMLMRSIILAESAALESERLGGEPRSLPPKCATGRCGDFQERIAMLLMKAGVAPSRLKMIQTNEAFIERLGHALLIYDTFDLAGEPIHVFIDPTFTQFLTVANPSPEDEEPGDFLLLRPAGVR